MHPVTKNWVKQGSSRVTIDVKVWTRGREVQAAVSYLGHADKKMVETDGRICLGIFTPNNSCN